MHTMKTQRSQNKLTNLKKKSGYVYTEDEMVGWHHRLNGHEFEQTPGDSERQGNLACCSQSRGSQRLIQDGG